jgi:pilus assembly protein CpaC
MNCFRQGIVARGSRRCLMGMLGLWLALALPAGLSGQQVTDQASQVIAIARGSSALLQPDQQVQRVLVGDPTIADYALVSPRELVVNGIGVGTTSLFVWDQGDNVRMYTIAVTPDVGALQRQLNMLFPDAGIELTASGEAVVVSGTIRDSRVARRALEILNSTGAQVIDNLVAPPPKQILLHVRFAEVDRSILRNLGSDLRALNPHDFGNVERIVGSSLETLSEGIVNLLLVGDNNTELEWFLRALRTRGYFKSLAEPNLVAVEGQEASFLAGGEFPYPSVQGGQNNQVSIQWKEYGVVLNFTPQITNDGSIRLMVAPEVSSLDFANGLTFAGFQIPSLITRRAETQVELRPGQSFAIAGLLDNQQQHDVDQIPILGQIPIIGTFFSNKASRDLQTELLVVVTPHIVEPMNSVPTLPTGDPADWDRSSYFDEGTLTLPHGVRIVPPDEAMSGGGGS